MIKMVGTSGDQSFDVTPEKPVILGRAVASDVPIFDPTISRRHAEVSLSGDGVRIKDLGSSNGTFINGVRITEGVAMSGDMVSFGKLTFHVQAVGQPAAVAERAGGMAARAAPETIVRKLPVESAPGLPKLSPDDAPGAAPALDDSPEKKLSLLLEISKALSRTQEVDQLLEKVVDYTFQVMNVDRASILFADDAGELIPRISRSRADDQSTSRHVPQSIARKAVEERVAILSDNAATDERFKGKSIVMQSVRSAMCTPLMGSDDTVLGILYVDNLTAIESFSDDDLEFLIAFGGIAAVAIENSQLSERIRREALVLTNFQRYFAPNIAEQILKQTGSIRLGGEKRNVIIFFSDIRGFTPMSEGMNPDEIASLMTEYFTEMVEIIFEHGGTLDKFIGDEIMAIWGAPLRHDDDPDRSMEAAVKQMRALRTLNERWQAQDRPEVAVGMGINFGEVFAGNIGSDQRLEYTVLGDPVNIASRLCSKAARNEILISESFYKALKNPPEVEALPPIALKGKTNEIDVYRVKW